jgi:plastocyanin
MRRTAWIAVSLLAIVAAGCSNGGHVAASSTAPSASLTERPIDPNFDYGDTILITATGFQPRFLLTNPKTTVTWENRTDHALRVVFDHQAVDSGTIPAGGTWTWTSLTPISVTYHDAERPGYKGSITVQT